MVQVGKYILYLFAFFLTINILIWIKYSVSPEEKTTKFERKLSYEEATNKLRGTIYYKTKNYYEGGSCVVKISTDGLFQYDYDTLANESSYYSKDKE